MKNILLMKKSDCEASYRCCKIQTFVLLNMNSRYIHRNKSSSHDYSSIPLENTELGEATRGSETGKWVLQRIRNCVSNKFLIKLLVSNC